MRKSKTSRLTKKRSANEELEIEELLETSKSNSKSNKPIARTVAGRESQLISLAVDLAAQQLKDGTASSQVITHYLKLGTTLAELEKEKLLHETLLLEAKTEALKSQKKVETLYQNALNAMRSYSGITTSEELEDNQ